MFSLEELWAILIQKNLMGCLKCSRLEKMEMVC